MFHHLVEVPPLVAELPLHLFHVHHETPEKDRTVSGFHAGPVPSFGAATAIFPEAYQNGRLPREALRKGTFLLRTLPSLRRSPRPAPLPRRGPARFVPRRNLPSGAADATFACQLRSGPPPASAPPPARPAARAPGTLARGGIPHRYARDLRLLAAIPLDAIPPFTGDIPDSSPGCGRGVSPPIAAGGRPDEPVRSRIVSSPESIAWENRVEEGGTPCRCGTMARSRASSR